MIKKTIPSSKSGANIGANVVKQNGSATLLNNKEWNKWQKAPKQPQGNLGMGFAAADDVSMDEETKKPASKVLKKSKKTDDFMEEDEPAGDDEEIPAATENQKRVALAADSEDAEMMPVRRRANKKRRVQQESSVDEDEAMATENQSKNERTPPRVLQTISDSNIPQNVHISEEPTAVT